AISMLAGAFGDDAPLLDPLRTLAVAAVLLAFRGHYSLRLGAGRGAGLVLGVAAGVVAAVVWVLLPVPGGGGSSAELTTPPGGWSPFFLASRLAGYVLVLPLAEELAFRGYLMRRLSRADWQSVSPQGVTLVAWILSSLLFGVL